MPKLTFYNLPEEKQRNLILAAQQEFSNAPLPEASIANIVKSAGIPRGSFYQYFEDKEDLYLFLLDRMMKKRKSQFEKILQKCNRDLFEGILEFYKVSLKEEEELPGFKKNVFLNMTNKAENTFAKIMTNEDSDEAFNEIEALIDVSKLNISGDKELYHLLKIIFAVTMRNRVEKFSKNLSYEEAAANYEIELNLLKKGLSRK